VLPAVFNVVGSIVEQRGEYRHSGEERGSSSLRTVFSKLLAISRHDDV
jgi:hypothetical protein